MVLFHGIFFLRLCLRAPSLNNAVYVISESQALITKATRSGRSVMLVLSGFFLVGFRFRFFSRNCLTLMSYNLVSYSVLQRSVTSFHVTCSVKDLLRALLQYLFNLRAARKRYSNYFQYNIFLRFLVDSAFFDPFQTSTHT